MNPEEVKALSEEELRIKAAELVGWRQPLEGDGFGVSGEVFQRYMWRLPCGRHFPPGPPDYPNDIAAAMELALSISDRYWMELHTPFRVGDPFFAGFTPLGTSGWNGCPDNQCEAGKPGEAITRAFVLVMTQEAE